MKTLSSIGKFYLYSNIHIAICAIFLVYETYSLLGIDADISYLLLVFSSTIIIYGLHRLEGLKRITTFSDLQQPEELRYRFIRSIAKTIKGLVVFCLLLNVYCFFHLPIDYILRLIPLGLLSLAYVIPIFGKNKRLRDFNFSKIIILSLVWAFLSVTTITGYTFSFFEAIFCLEHFLYFIAITIPFDIRDAKIDLNNNVFTIGNVLKPKQGYMLSFSVLLTSFSLIFLLFWANEMKLSTFSLYALGYIFTLCSIGYSFNKKNDLLFTGWIDAGIGVRGLLLFLFV